MGVVGGVSPAPGALAPAPGAWCEWVVSKEGRRCEEGECGDNVAVSEMMSDFFGPSKLTPVLGSGLRGVAGCWAEGKGS